MKLEATNLQLDSLSKNKQNKGINLLKQMNILTNFNDSNLYHGRNSKNKNWDVISNKDNNTIYFKEPGKCSLYVSNYAIAKEFALLDNKENASINLIQSIDDNSLIINNINSVFKLDNKDSKKFNKAINLLNIPNFTSIDSHPYLIEIFQFNLIIKYLLTNTNNPYKLINNSLLDNLESILKNSSNTTLINKIDIDFINIDKLKNYISSYNSNILISLCADKILDKYFNTDTYLDNFYIDYDNQTYSVNNKYISNFLQKNHIIGFKSNILSSSVKHNIDYCYLFDLDKVYNNPTIEKMHNYFDKIYSNLNDELTNLVSENNFKFIKDSNSIELLDFIKQDELLHLLYSMKTNNFEGFCVYEHTCAVLDIFDKYYSYKYPNNLKVLIKLALLGHDIGKGFLNPIDNEKKIEAISKKLNLNSKDLITNFSNSNQNLSNNFFYPYFIKVLNINQKYAPLLIYLMSDSQKYTTDYFIRHKNNPNKIDDLNIYLTKLTKDIYKQVFNNNPSNDDLDALIQASIDIQQSDSGSYTLFSKIPMTKNHQYISGVNQDFTNSFIKDNHNNYYLKDNPYIDIYLLKNKNKKR